MSQNLLRVLVLTAVVCAAAPALAEAQIYTWRDEGGNLVVSNTPMGGGNATYAVVNVTSSIRSTRQADSPRAARFEPLIVEYASAHDVRPDLVRAVIQAESAFDPFARSHKGAMGLMQLMPATAEELGVQDPYDPAENIRGGVKYLKSLLVKYSDNEELALAAYNAGPGAVARYDGIPPYRETRNYVAKITRQANSRPAAAAVERRVEIVDGREVTRFVSVGGKSAASRPQHSDHR